MTDEILKRLAIHIAKSVTDEAGEKIISFLFDNEGKYFTDEEIASSLGLRINDVRKALYDLAKEGMVTYRRESASGSVVRVYQWYTDKSLVKRAVMLRLRKTLEKLEVRLKFEEQNVFYVCPLDGSRYTFDEAVEYYFKCPRCGSDLVEDSNRDAAIKRLKQSIESVKRVLELVEKA